MNKNTERRITEQFAEFIVTTSYAKLPSEAVAAAKRAVLDHVGVTIAGSLEPAGKKVAHLVKQMGCTPKAAVVGMGFRTSSCEAALINGIAVHTLDYDDVSINSGGYPVSIHLTSILLSAILALGEELKATGEDIITAYVIGYEVASQLANAMGADFGDDLGWHPSAPLGVVGAGAACSKLLNLDVSPVVSAIGIAASQAAGLRQNFGTMTKSFQIGNAARGGILSALMAKDGFTAASDALEGRYGFCHAFSGGRGYDVNKIPVTLGQSLQLLYPGPAVKLYPCCGSAHGPLNGLFSLFNKYDIQPDKVSAIEVSVPFDPPRSLVYDNPKTGLEGKFSLQYCLAAAFLDRKVGMETFTTEQVQRQQARELFDKITMFRKPEMKGKPSWEPAEYVITVKMVNGQAYSEKTNAPFAAPVRIPTWQELSGKFRDCAGMVLAEYQVETSLEIISTFEKLKNITRLADIIIKGKN
jgi:2-methylcitrate dehydratase PrpD